MNPHVAIVTDDPGWHGAQLRGAFARRGCRTTYVSLPDCTLELVRGASGVRIPGFGNGLPDGAFVRGVPGGTLEEVVFYLDVLHALRELGIPVYNDARAIERSVDKAMTSFLLHRAGIRTPATYVTVNRQAARRRVGLERAGGEESVLKPLFGSQGKGLRRLRKAAEVPAKARCHGVYYLQRFIRPSARVWQDWRVFVVGGRAITSMRRCGRRWITNVAQGAECHPSRLEEELARTAERAVRALDMHYAGVDLMRDADGGWIVLEVNSVPAWKGLQGVCGINIAQSLVDDFLDHAPARLEEATG